LRRDKKLSPSAVDILFLRTFFGCFILLLLGRGAAPGLLSQPLGDWVCSSGGVLVVCMIGCAWLYAGYGFTILLNIIYDLLELGCRYCANRLRQKSGGKRRQLR